MTDQGKITNTYALLTKLIQAIWLDIGQVLVCTFIDRDEIVVNKSAKRTRIEDLCANVHIFALMNVSSHYLSPIHANDCVFARNEQQKV